jgi:ubiquinone/menaquinone biosynthesis C-methylase UbiE
MHEVLAGRDQRQCSVLDVGCGTGRFLDFVKQAWPRLTCVGMDMSEASSLAEVRAEQGISGAEQGIYWGGHRDHRKALREDGV